MRRALVCPRAAPAVKGQGEAAPLPRGSGATGPIVLNFINLTNVEMPPATFLFLSFRRSLFSHE